MFGSTPSMPAIATPPAPPPPPTTAKATVNPYAFKGSGQEETLLSGGLGAITAANQKGQASGYQPPKTLLGA